MQLTFNLCCTNHEVLISAFYGMLMATVASFEVVKVQQGNFIKVL